MEIRSGIRNVLAMPWIYDGFQMMVGAYARRKFLINHFIIPVIPRQCILIDIGCGTAEILKYLPRDIRYIGLDRNPVYIEKAAKRYRHLSAAFYCEEIAEQGLLQLPSADVVLAFGVLHHLDDENSINLLELVKKNLGSSGFLLTLDPVFDPHQSIMARYIISKDRGAVVRTEPEYQELVLQVCSRVDISIGRNPLRIPFTDIVMKCYF